MAEARPQKKLQDPLRVLRDLLSQGVTGCLCLRESDERRVYLMQGEILAAHGPDDSWAVLRRLLNNGALTEVQGERLHQRLAAGDSLDELLFGHVPDELLLDVLAMRFRQCVLDFMFGTIDPEFEPMEAVFVDNIQVGHDSRALLVALEATRERVRAIRARQHGLTVAPGRGRPTRMQEARLLDLFDVPHRLSDLVQLSPFEEGETLEIVLDMVSSGLVLIDGLFPQDDDEPTEVGAGLDEVSADAVTPTPVPLASLTSTLVPQELVNVEEEAVEDLGTLEVNAELTEVELTEVELTEVELVDLSTDAISELTEGTGGDDAVERQDAEDAFRDELNRQLVDDVASGDGDGAPVVRPPGFDYDTPDDDIELSMFVDQDMVRGRGDGNYVSERHNLDVVDLSDIIKPDTLSGDDPIPVDDDSALTPEERRAARMTTFAPPTLDEDEVRTRLEVVNGALGEIASAYDETNGPGSGKGAVQQLVEGTPPQFKPLLLSVEADSNGQLNEDLVVRNLMARPEGERRQLLQRAVGDLFERALTLAYEDLDEEAADALAERVLDAEKRLEKML